MVSGRRKKTPFRMGFGAQYMPYTGHKCFVYLLCSGAGSRSDGELLMERAPVGDLDLA